MQLSKVTQLNANNPIPVYGVEAKEKKQVNAKAESKKTEVAVDGQEMSCRVAMCAYFKAEARGFEPGYELEDWLAAEAEVGK